MLHAAIVVMNANKTFYWWYFVILFCYPPSEEKHQMYYFKTMTHYTIEHKCTLHHTATISNL